MTIVFKDWSRKTCLTVEFDKHSDGEVYIKIDGCKEVPLSDVLWIES